MGTPHGDVSQGAALSLLNGRGWRRRNYVDLIPSESSPHCPVCTLPDTGQALRKCLRVNGKRGQPEASLSSPSPLPSSSSLGDSPPISQAIGFWPGLGF